MKQQTDCTSHGIDCEWVHHPFLPYFCLVVIQEWKWSGKGKKNHSRIYTLECRWTSVVGDLYRVGSILLTTPDRAAYTWKSLRVQSHMARPSPCPPTGACQLFLLGKLWTLLSRAHIIASEFLASLKEKGQNAEVLGVGFLGRLKDLADK